MSSHDVVINMVILFGGENKKNLSDCTTYLKGQLNLNSIRTYAVERFNGNLAKVSLFMK